ncbi:MAG: HAMP domain-containing protein [Spirochaetales bacterium]|nr:HAMP domain-containing protein [Spirochaetales bacterium]
MSDRKSINRPVPRGVRLGLAPRLIGMAVLIALLTGALVGVTLIQTSRGVLRKHILESNAAAADLTVEYTEQFFTDAKTSLLHLASWSSFTKAITGNDLRLTENTIKEFMDIKKVFDSVSIYDDHGIGWASGLGDAWQNRGGTVADREWFQQTMALKAAYLGTPLLSRGTNQPIITYSLPIFDGKGKIHAVLASGLSLARLSNTINSLQEGAYLIDTRQGGVFLAHPDPALIMTKVRGLRQAEQHALAGERGTMETHNPDGSGDMAAFAPVPGLPWSIIKLTPLTEAYAPLDSLTLQAVLYVTAIMLAAVILGIILARSIVKPVRELVRGTAELGRGNLDYRIKVKTRNEIGQLSLDFNRMALDLKSVTASRDDLDREIAERKRAEGKLREVNEDLQRSNRELEQFAYVASHDLQEPLRMVSSYTQLLAQRFKDALDQDARDFIGFAVDGANRMQRLIQDLLAYSRITTRGKTPEPVAANDALGEALVNLQTAVSESGALVTNDDLPSVQADYTQLVLLFQNLIGNAVKFRKPDEPPRVHVSATRSPDDPRFWIFRVADNGIGVDAKYFDRIFVIFQRLHAREAYPGTGIGLSVCQRIVIRHGGRIWLESAAGRGTTFFFTLYGEQKGESP